MTEQQYYKGACTHCNGRIEFPAGAAGTTIACPHCKGATTLVPPASAAPGQSLKCACAHCRGRIAFPASAAGAMIACPHCGQATQLTAPGGVAPAGAPAPASAAAERRPAAAAPSSLGVSVRKPQAASAGSAIAEAVAELESATAAAPPGNSAKRKKVFIIAGASAAVLAIAAAVVFFVLKPGQISTPKRPDYDLDVVNFELQKAKDGGLVYVVGTLTNHAEIQYFTLRVEFDLVNSEGNVVGNTSDYLGNLGPNSAWNFKALVLEQDASEAKLVKVMGEKE